MRLALYQPEIPQNVGTMIRLCTCFGVPVDVIEPTGFLWGDKYLKRAGLDYLEMASVERIQSWDIYQKQCSAQRIVLIDTKAETSFWDFAFLKSDILMLGKESSGVPDTVFDAIPFRVRIPMLPQFRSLNVAVAGAMVLAEAYRQTKNDFPPFLR